MNEKNIDILVNNDKARIQRVLVNFISNAIKFTKQGKIEAILYDVTIDENQNELIKLEVTDTGDGIRDDVKDKICNKFFTCGT